MPRDHAQIRLSIWGDDDFRALPADAQHLYLILLTHPELSYCGVMDWRPAKLSGLVGDWTGDDVRAAAAVLIERLYIVVDETTEEVLVRSFVRRDGLMKQPKMATAMATAHAGVGSIALRGVVVGELQRLKEEQPDLNGWGSEKASELLSKASVNPSTYPCGKGSGNPSGEGSGEGFPRPSGEGSGKASVSPSSLLQAPSSSAPSSNSAPNGAGRRRPPTRPNLRTVDDVEDPTAQTLVAFYVDRHTRRPPSSVVGQVAKHIGALLAEGFDPDAIRRGLTELVRKSLNPAVLPSLVNEAVNVDPRQADIDAIRAHNAAEPWNPIALPDGAR